MMELLAVVLIAQVLGKWVDLEICAIDRRGMPHVAKRLSPPEILSVWVTNERKPGLIDINPRPEGLNCVQITYLGNSLFVVGTRDQVKAMLDLGLPIDIE